MESQVFKSKIDLWLLLLVFGVQTGAAALNVFLALKLRDPLGAWIGLSATIFVLVFCAWLFARTQYEVGDREILIRCGPFSWRVALDAIAAVTPTRNPLSAPALSLDRLEIRYGAGKSILVSPGDRAGFLRALARRSPHLALAGEELRRKG